MRQLGQTVSVISQSAACVGGAAPRPGALKARGLDSRVLLEQLIISLPDAPHSAAAHLFSRKKKNVWTGLAAPQCSAESTLLVVSAGLIRSRSGPSVGFM